MQTFPLALDALRRAGEMMAGFPLSITVRPPTIYPEIGMKGEKAIYSTKGEDMGAVPGDV